MPACFAQSPCIRLHILIISSWSNYSAACITLFMWHTISRQLTWASKCQPIGCAITLLSDISISAVLPCITLRQQGEEMSHATVCISLFLCLHIHSYLWSCINIRFCFFLCVLAFLTAHEHFLNHCFYSFSFFLAPHHISACLLIFCPRVCHLFVSCLWVCSSGNQVSNWNNMLGLQRKQSACPAYQHEL